MERLNDFEQTCGLLSDKLLATEFGGGSLRRCERATQRILARRQDRRVFRSYRILRLDENEARVRIYTGGGLGGFWFLEREETGEWILGRVRAIGVDD